VKAGLEKEKVAVLVVGGGLPECHDLLPPNVEVSAAGEVRQLQTGVGQQSSKRVTNHESWKPRDRFGADGGDNSFRLRLRPS